MNIYKQYLIQDIMPFWLNHSIDWEHGGIFTCLDRTGALYSTEKSVWFQGRALWVFSKVYNTIDKNEKYLAAAQQIYGFLHKCIDENGRLYYLCTRDGKPLQKSRDLYSEAFAALGCCEYYLATGDSTVWASARSFFQTAYVHWEEYTKSASGLLPETAEFTSLAPSMILLNVAQNMRQIDPCAYNTIAKVMSQVILNGGFFLGDALLEHVNQSGAPNFDNPTGRIINPGHALEAAWFLMTEGLYQQDPHILKKALRIVDYTMEIGFSNGGIVSFCDYLGKPPLAVDADVKRWWPQCEALIANKMAYNLSKSRKYKEQFEALWAYVMEHFADSEHGEWYGYLHYDNTISSTLKGNVTKGPFHIPRMLIWLSQDADGQK